MDFCNVCNNMLYVKSNENRNLVKYCKHCDFSMIVESNNSSIKISETMYSEDDLLYCQNINKYLRYDPTLRRINDEHIKCPNSDCSTITDSDIKQQVLYIKYHPQNMKYLYVCDHCGHIWR